MVKGIPQFQAMLRKKHARIIDAAKSAARQGGEEVAKHASFLAPRDQLELVRSIRVEDAATIKTRAVDRDFVGVVVKAGDETTIVTNARGARFQNAKLQETGTRNMPANPYFNPAWRANRARVRGRITRAIRKAWLSE